MLAIAAGAVAFLAVYFGIAALGRFERDRPADELRHASRRLRELGEGGNPFAEQEGGAWFHASLKRFARRLIPWTGDRDDGVQLQLSLAGYRHPSAVSYFTAIRLGLVVVGALAGGITAGAMKANWSRILLWGGVGSAVGFITPAFLLRSRVNARQRALRNALPDAMDILVLSVEGGVSMNAALACVTDEIRTVHPILGGELGTVQHEMQLGLSSGEAFRAFADRCGISEARDLAAALVQSEKYGASVAKALRAYADSARQDRQLWAEETAQKASVKIIFPMMLCIFPAMFIVLLGPAAYQMSNLFAR